MGFIRYIRKQKHAAHRAEMNVLAAERIRNNLLSLAGMSDSELKIQSTNAEYLDEARTYGREARIPINELVPEASIDEVYAKLGRIERSEPVFCTDIIRGNAKLLMKKIESRTMTQLEYNCLFTAKEEDIVMEFTGSTIPF